MAKKLSTEELTAVKAALGAKGGLVVAMHAGLEKKYFGIPIVLTSLGAGFLTGKKTDTRIQNIAKSLKIASLKSNFNLHKKAALKKLLVPGLIMGAFMAPKPRQVATKIISAAGKPMKMKEVVKLPKPKI